jgi:general stress protein 26
MRLTIPFLYEFISRHKLAVVSTNGLYGHPQSALVGIAVSRDLEIYFDTVDTTRKIANMRRDPKVSLVIGWENEQSLQYEGVADEPRSAELASLKSIYFEAWPDGPDRQTWEGITYCRVRPAWLRFSSFVEPQLIEEMRFDAR